jgi:ABC-type sugar transport system ATPase subunit
MTDPLVAVDGSVGASSQPGPVVALENISKHYGAVQALRDVSLELWPGKIVGLVGDNGAGKSTIIKILSGVTQPSGGRILVEGEKVQNQTPLHALEAGIETVYQDLALSPDLSVWANFFLGRETLRKGPLRVLGALDERAMIEYTREELKALKIRIADVKTQCKDLSGGQRQAVAVGRAIAWGRKLLLMDEPTAALGISQRDRVGDLASEARDRGIPVLAVSHDLPWVRDLCDEVLVLYRGRITGRLTGEQLNIDNMIRYITGVARDDDGEDS